MFVLFLYKDHKNFINKLVSSNWFQRKEEIIVKMVKLCEKYLYCNFLEHTLHYIA
jgi:hypothetical protein